MKNDTINEKKKLKVALYIRLSTDDQKEMYWEDLQLASLEWLLKSREYDLELAWPQYIYKDLWVSGSLKIEDRPWLNRLFNDLKYGKPFQIVAIYKIDRLGRKLSTLLDIVERLEYNEIGFISTLESLDTSSPFWKAMLWILWVFAELEKDMNQKKMSEWLIASVKKWNKVNDVYWYDRYLVWKMKHFKKNIDEEKIIKSIFEDYVSAQHKWDVWYIRNRLTEKKVYIPSVAEKIKKNKSINTTGNLYKWHNTAIKRILSDETYIWIYYYWKTSTTKDKITNKSVTKDVPKSEWVKANVKHISIISDTLFYKAQEILEKEKSSSHRNKHTKDWNVYIFSWLLKCDNCKSHRINWWMFTWIWETSNKIMQYVCKWKHKDSGRICHTIPLKTEDLDKIILWEIRKIILNPIAIKKYVANEKIIQDWKLLLEKELEEIEEQIGKYTLWQENIYKRLKFWQLSDAEYDNDYEDLENLIIIEKQKANEINEKLQWHFELEDYSNSFNLLNDLLKNEIEDILNDKLKAQKLVNYLVDEIIIYSKDNDWTYSISWSKKEWRQIPYKIEVKLKLPQVFLNDFMTLNNISNSDDLIWEHLWKKVEEKEEEIEKDKNKKWKWWWKWSWGWGSSNYDKATNTLKNIKKDLTNNIIRVKQQLSPFKNNTINSISFARTDAIFEKFWSTFSASFTTRSFSYNFKPGIQLYSQYSIF